MKYQLLTYGCQMNVRDSETIAALVETSGYSKTEDLLQADLIILNTCSVRHSAENKVFGKLGEIKKLKTENPGLIIALGGCMAQLEEIRKKTKRIGVDVLFGTHNIHELPELLTRAREQGKPQVQVWEQEGGICEDLPVERNPGINAFVNIMYGCNNFCSYCIVPYTRGRERSRRPGHILKEMEDIAARGYKEVTLLGQNVNSYGQGLQEQVDFAGLLQAAGSLPGIERIRFTTSHPKDVGPRLVEAMKHSHKICENLHAPLQAGSDRILHLMNRGYTREYYLELVKHIRREIPGVTLSTDLIVGFPGETESDFEQTLDMVEKIRFDNAFTFMYSVRRGTRAADMEDQVPLEVKKTRLLTLNRLQYDIALTLNRQLEGTEQEILVEGASKNNPDRLTGRTRGNRIVIFSGPKHLIGNLINVRIIRGNTFSLFGEPVAN